MTKAISIIFAFVFVFLFNSCMQPKILKHIGKTHTNSTYLQHQDIADGVKNFISDINNAKRLRRKKISLYLSKTKTYKEIIEQIFIEQKSRYRYTVIDRDISDELEFEHSISNTQDTINTVDIVIKTSISNNNLNIKAQLLSNSSILAVANIPIKYKKTKYIEYKQLTYIEAIKYCQNKNSSLPSLEELESLGIGHGIQKYFWSSKTLSGDEAYGFNFLKDEPFIGFMSDEYHVKCAN